MQEMLTFEALGLDARIVQAVQALGYEAPTPIQTEAIAPLLEGRDVLGQAQTGTGKTAAFSLPMIQRLDMNIQAVQALILVPTRELAIQVGEAIQNFGTEMGVKVLPVYGGVSIEHQIKRLRRDTHIVVGTPGRVMDHIRRGTFSLDNLRMIVLDEADEMLSMGFDEDIEWILGQITWEHQTALFSATIPAEIRHLINRYMRDPVEILIKKTDLSVPQIDQRLYIIPASKKLAALIRLLETEPYEAVLIFTHTRIGAMELAEAMLASGYTVDALHGEVTQPVRETIVRKLRTGLIKVVVATEVAARGLDIDNITHVINYDIPHDAEAYVHRIGRTGRAGRAGVAITFATPGEARRVRMIEGFLKIRLQPRKLPTRDDMAQRRSDVALQLLTDTLQTTDFAVYYGIVSQLMEQGWDNVDIAAAALHMADAARNANTFTLATLVDQPHEIESYSNVEPPRKRDVPGSSGSGSGGGKGGPRGEKTVRLFINRGQRDGIRPGDIVGMLANEGGISGREINEVQIMDNCAFAEIPASKEKQVLEKVTKTILRGKPTSVSLARADQGRTEGSRPRSQGYRATHHNKAGES